MSEKLISLTIELIVGFIALLFSLKITGKRQVSQISPFDFVSAVILGEMVGNAMYDVETNLYYILYAIAIWTALVYVIEKVTEKYRVTRKLIIGSPQIIIKDGLINFKLLKKENIDFDELISMLRGKDVFSVREVEYAIIEINGDLSVKKKEKYEQATRGELNIKTTNSSTLNLPVILDGEIIEENLSLIGINKHQLMNNLKSNQINSINDVLYGEYSINDGYYFQKYYKL